MKYYIRRLVCYILFVVIFLIGPVQCAEAKTTTTKVSASALQKGLQYTLTDMPYNGKYSPLSSTYKKESFTVRTVQNFALTPDGKYIFTVSEGYSGKESANKKHTILTRCKVPSKKGEKAEAECVDAIILDGYGHGEAIAVTQPSSGSEIYNIWVACTPNGGNYGTEIARLTYKVSGGKGKITKRVRLTNFAQTATKITKKKTTAAYLTGSKKKSVRLNVAVDPSSNKIAFRIELNNGGKYFVVYDFKKLEAALNKVKNNKTYNMANACGWQKALINSNLVPSKTFQSFTLDGKYLYVCGGHKSKGAGIYVIPYKTAANGKAVEQKLRKNADIAKIINIEPKITVDGTTLGGSKIEIEGMKSISNGNKTDFYVNFFMDGVSIRSTIGIYKFTK